MIVAISTSLAVLLVWHPSQGCCSASPALSVSSDFPPSIPWAPPYYVAEETTCGQGRKDVAIVCALKPTTSMHWLFYLFVIYSHLKFILLCMLCFTHLVICGLLFIVTTRV